MHMMVAEAHKVRKIILAVLTDQPKISKSQQNKILPLFQHTVLWRLTSCGGYAPHGHLGTQAPSAECLCLPVVRVLSTPLIDWKRK